MDTRTGKVFEISDRDAPVVEIHNFMTGMPRRDGVAIINEKNCIHVCKYCAERNCDKRSRKTRAKCVDFDPKNGSFKYNTRFGIGKMG